MEYRARIIGRKLDSGFTLLEILIAILIISIGLAALANLQGKLTQYGAIAKQRTLAMNLAEQQIETMQSFYTMGDTGADACAVAPTGFDDLKNCTSGATVSAGNMQFNMTWSVDNYTQNADGTTTTWTSGSGSIRPDLKMVTIGVEWTNGQGDTHGVELVDIVDATPIFNTGRISARVDSNVPPRTPFNPADFPGVVEIAIGNQKIKGSTTPEPKIENRGNNVITTFDVVTFLRAGDNAYLQRREEFKVVNCICTMDAGLGTGREPTMWDGHEYALGELVAKRTGSVSANETGQPYGCEMCCNDHHDGVGAVDKYDSFRPAFSGDAGSFNFYGDHAHYQIVDGAKVLAGEGDDYLEACRLIRKDGLFKLTTDMSRQNLDVVRQSYPTIFNSQYSTSVINFVTAFSGGIVVPNYPPVLPDVTYSAPWWLDWWGIFLSNAGIVHPAMSRGIYIDYMNADLLKKIKCLQADGSGTYSDYCNVLKDPTWLEILPFYDVDLTSLSNWNRGSTAITVTNSPISDIDRSSFSRGEVELAQQHFDVNTYVAASIERSNTGLTDTNPIDPDDELEDDEDIPVRVVIGGTPPAIGGQVLGDIFAGSNKINVETVRVSQNPPAIPCDLVTVTQGHTTSKTYTCDLYPIPVTGTVTISDYNAVKVTGS
ncbi:MAG: prepilin-type N-terminal cleavage/methylation domain-containing protein, partial [Xanthomonadales bacterium]|nr:prepilin-type N-terminal cleavage/methylation domain-containing protein [Xanthomonadales bacterium]